jgi:2-polyprenyl-3-methyl-5-hydroxy-6-metoxy-1,4-benzoquinol methylase
MRFVPRFLRPVLRPVYRAARSQVDAVLHRPKSRSELHDYWRAPADSGNQPVSYLESGHARSQFLVSLVRRYAQPSASILEIGCNTGRNLDHLHRAGYTNLMGIEISEPAINLLRQSYPHLGHSQVYLGSVEDLIGKVGTFDVVFTMAVFEHLHSDSAWVFKEIAGITRTLITIEDEHHHSWRHFPRNYKRIFEPLGLRQVEEQTRLPELSAEFVARVFQR